MITNGSDMHTHFMDGSDDVLMVWYKGCARQWLQLEGVDQIGFKSRAWCIREDCVRLS
jgi:hypothetical protein